MPYRDPEKKRLASAAWRKHVMPRGYGRWLYQRRKLRFDNEERFRFAIERALAELGVPTEAYATPVSNAVDILATALRESQEAEEALGQWQAEDPPEDDEDE